MWATAADVTSFTGLALPATPDPNAVMSLASSDITIYANRTEAASAAMSTRDLHWLRMATAFQAAWLTEQPDYLARVNFRTSTVDGESVSFRSDSEQICRRWRPGPSKICRGSPQGPLVPLMLLFRPAGSATNIRSLTRSLILIRTGKTCNGPPPQEDLHQAGESWQTAEADGHQEGQEYPCQHPEKDEEI